LKKKKIITCCMTAIGTKKKGYTMSKRYMIEYGNDILRRKKELFFSKESLTEMETRINKVIKLYDRGYVTVTETMRTLVDIDNDY